MNECKMNVYINIHIFQFINIKPNIKLKIVKEDELVYIVVRTVLFCHDS